MFPWNHDKGYELYRSPASPCAISVKHLQVERVQPGLWWKRYQLLASGHDSCHSSISKAVWANRAGKSGEGEVEITKWSLITCILSAPALCVPNWLETYSWESVPVQTRAGRENMSTIKAFRNIIFTFYRYGEIIDKTNASDTKLHTIGYISDFQPKNEFQVCCDKHYKHIFGCMQ